MANKSATTQSSKSSIIAKKLETMIIDGSLTEGQKLPSERALSQTLKVSRNCLREAIKELNARGVLETKRGSGTHVALFKDIQPSRSLIDLLNNDKKTLTDMFYVRRLLESEATKLATINATKQDKDKISEAFQQLVNLEHSDDGSAVAEKDIAFHRSIYMAANNQVLLLALNSIRDLMMNFMYMLGDKVYPFAQNHRDLIAQHQRIYDAIIKGDAQEAQDAANAHIDAVKQYIKLK
ncbi:FadR/GntR family transcriptional regulator [Thalassotalea psychrophila]|uniref:FadR/GntR family transcriptional regulator n=1 Tax=Thalassotalea psychrophila TaxID=3065647 RepID=A0ABY9TYV3_9GAMM|nr:FadR/GntR family transcriptional regulator [Colwelliaceae bacterium SQ149]